MTDRRKFAGGAGRCVTAPLAKVAGYRHFRQRVFGTALFGVAWAALRLGERLAAWVRAAPVLVVAGLALVQPRPPLPGLEAPGDDAPPRISETP